MRAATSKITPVETRSGPASGGARQTALPGGHSITLRTPHTAHFSAHGLLGTTGLTADLRGVPRDQTRQSGSCRAAGLGPLGTQKSDSAVLERACTHMAVKTLQLKSLANVIKY